jgi:cell division protein FtsI/penicillin-binding protein 2
MSESNDANKPSGTPRRWYEQDPLLVEVLELLRAYPADVREQAQIFLSKIEEQIGKDTLEKFYELSVPKKKRQPLVRRGSYRVQGH